MAASYLPQHVFIDTIGKGCSLGKTSRQLRPDLHDCHTPRGHITCTNRFFRICSGIATGW